MNRLRKNSNAVSGNFMETVSPKMIMAAILLIIMAGLWMRVLLRGRSGPAKAAAQSVVPSAAASDPAEKSVRIRPLTLPVVSGRHDRIQTDPFVLDAAQWFYDSKQTPATSSKISDVDLKEQKTKADLHRIAQRLVLEAVVKDTDGVPIKACVNGTVLFRGSTIKIQENGELYELKVTEIRATEIKLVWQVFDLTIRMPSSEWLNS